LLSTSRLNNALLNNALLNNALLNNALLNNALRGGRALISADGGRRLISAMRGSRRKALVCMGTAAVITAGAGAAGAAATSGRASVPPGLHAPASVLVVSSPQAQLSSTSGLTSGAPAVVHATGPAGVSLPAAQQAAAAALPGGPARPASRPAVAAAAAPAGAVHPGAAPATPEAAPAAPAAAAPAAPAAAAPAAPAAPQLNTWPEIEDAAAHQAGTLPAMNMPLPVPVTAPQSQMPMSGVQWQNATTITQQALNMGMGMRSAVIAVATAMQESNLINIDYGTYDSLGLFQQRPSAGWGTPAQVTNPVYASDAFLDALHVYQLNNPGWAYQPVWEPAQGVQDSAYPYAYAQWEIQAANIVVDVTKNLLS
jgi:hypothetical protein